MVNSDTNYSKHLVANKSQNLLIIYGVSYIITVYFRDYKMFEEITPFQDQCSTEAHYHFYSQKKDTFH